MPDTTTTPSPVVPRMTTGLLLVMAGATGLAVANIYYNQPMLGLIAADLNAGAGISLVPTATQLGYALGMLLLVPLGDRMDRRRLILCQTVALCLSLAAAAAAPGLLTLAAASVAVGVTASIAQQIIPFAAELALPAQRGRVVGAVMSGLLAGVLLARVVSGLVGERLGWRAMFWFGAALAVAMGVLLARFLPRSRPSLREPYGVLLASLLHLTRVEPALRRASLTQGALFAAFSAFWTTLALLLQGPGFRMGSDVAGLFGVLALGGVFIAPYAGRLADTRGPDGVVRVGVLTVLAGFVVMGALPSLAGLVIGVVLLDAGLQLAMIANQTVIFGLQPNARSRVNTVFMTALFTGGAIGSAAASAAWSAAGWRAVAGVGCVFALLGLGAQLAGGRRR